MKFLLPLLLLGSLVSQCYSQPGELYYSQEIIKSDDVKDESRFPIITMITEIFLYACIAVYIAVFIIIFCDEYCGGNTKRLLTAIFLATFVNESYAESYYDKIATKIADDINNHVQSGDLTFDFELLVAVLKNVLILTIVIAFLVFVFHAVTLIRNKKKSGRITV